jgi:hypothetical protein
VKGKGFSEPPNLMDREHRKSGFLKRKLSCASQKVLEIDTGEKG